MPLGKITVEADVSLPANEDEGAEKTNRVLALPGTMLQHVLVGRGRKLLVFVDSDFLPAGTYQFEGTKLVLDAQTVLRRKMETVTVINPLDGVRWTWRDEVWSAE